MNEVALSGDDRDTIPLYEQIYALAGLTQFYRITLDRHVLDDIRRTVRMFNAFYLDGFYDPADGAEKASGYFSHLDYATMRPDVPALGKNQARKNWNSNGDHLPAYLINLILALEPLPNEGTEDLKEFVKECKWMLEHTTAVICQHFSPDRQPTDGSRYVNERFLADWTADHSLGAQMNCAIVGHNLKIAWNLSRVGNYFDTLALRDEPGARDRATRCRVVARKIADAMAEAGIDQIRGGCFHALERIPRNGMPLEFAGGSLKDFRGSVKDFWQQEQAILAYLIMYGIERDGKYLSLARHTMAFWNVFFLDHDYNGINFRVSDDGIPITNDGYGVKGNHALSGYHAFELSLLGHLYIRAYVSKDDPGFALYFKPDRDCKASSINVLPDFFPPESIHLERVTVDESPRQKPLPMDFQISLSKDELGCPLVAEFLFTRPSPVDG